MGYKVAVVGATGNVGREMLNILAERRVSRRRGVRARLAPLDGRRGSFGDKRLKCRDLENFDFSGVDFALMSAGSAVSKEWSPRIGAQGCIVIDNSSCWRYDPDVPLIVPEVNADAVAGFTKKNIIANPNCSTAQLVVALKPLHDLAKIKRVVVATYQSVSGAGKEAMDELCEQTKRHLRHRSARAARIHQADRLQRHSADRRLHGRRLDQGRMEDGGRDQEDPRSQDQAHRHLRARAGVRRPFRSGQYRVRDADHAPRRRASILREAPGVLVIDKREPGGYVTPVECVGDYATYVSRIREDPTVENGLVLVGACRTICARAPRSTRCRSPS